MKEREYSVKKNKELGKDTARKKNVGEEKRNTGKRDEEKTKRQERASKGVEKIVKEKQRRKK